MKQLFTEFPPISIDEWEKVIQKDLKGQDYDKKLIWKTDEDFSVRPYYSEESTSQLKIPNPPGMPNNWNTVEEISISSPQLALERFKKSLDAGADSWKFISIWNQNEVLGLDLSSEEEILDFSKSILSALRDFRNTTKFKKPDTIRFFWDTSSSSPVYIKAWIHAVQNYSLDGCSIQSYFFQDPLSALTVCGEFPNSQEKVWQSAKENIQLTEKCGKSIRSISVNAINFANSGANLTQELAYALSMGSEYISQLTAKGLKAEQVAAQIVFRFAVGANYFHEIAKLRSFRFLWNQVLEAYGISEDLRSCEIITETSEWNTTLFDPYVNMLRVTTEAMSAILGGSNALLVHPFNHGFQEEDDFSKRISLNVQHLLRHETYMDMVVDPSNGSYYIDSITAQFSENAWKLFQETEGQGGYISAFTKEIIQKNVKSISETKRSAILKKKDPILGTSQYPNPTEKLLKTSKPDPIKKAKAPFPEFSGESDIHAPYLTTWRAAEDFEKLRLHMEESAKAKGKKPVVQLFITGNRSMRTARASFVTNFFGVAGFEINNPGAMEDPTNTWESFVQTKPDFLVFCSSDDEYSKICEDYLSKLKSKLPSTKFFIAGNPPEQDKMKALGIDDFIHAKSHLFNTLKDLI
ncbi:MAG: hypothetical protein JJT78_00250 [Leptospira sp.]|nr:hypothetical protein [Leptospira sp.]